MSFIIWCWLWNLEQFSKNLRQSNEQVWPFIFMSGFPLIPYLTGWRADWRCRSWTSILVGLWQYACPSQRWDPSIEWLCHSIAVLVSLFRACPRPSPPLYLFLLASIKFVQVLFENQSNWIQVLSNVYYDLPSVCLCLYRYFRLTLLHVCQNSVWHFRK